MTTIKTWEERLPDDRMIMVIEREQAMQTEINELREAIRVAQEEIERQDREYSERGLLLFDTERDRAALQAKLSAIEAQEPVAELELVGFGIGDARRLSIKWLMDGYPPVGTKLFSAPVAPAQPVSAEVCHPAKVTSDLIGGFTARIDLANAKAAQPLTKEQVEKVLDALLDIKSGLAYWDRAHKKVDEAIEIMKGVRG